MGGSIPSVCILTQAPSSVPPNLKYLPPTLNHSIISNLRNPQLYTNLDEKTQYCVYNSSCISLPMSFKWLSKQASEWERKKKPSYNGLASNILPMKAATQYTVMCVILYCNSFCCRYWHTFCFSTSVFFLRISSPLR